MRRIIGTFIALAGLSGPALADCGGDDLMARLAVEEPATHAAILADAAAIPNGEGRLWRVEREGAGPSFLFATYHDTTAIETMTPAAREAFEAARMLVVELSAEEMERLNARVSTDPTFVFAPEGQGVAARLDAGLRARAEAVLAERGMTVEMAERLRPWMFFSVMGIPACELEAMARGAQVMDQVLLERAAASGKAIVGLETYEEALGAFGQVDPEIAAEVASDMIRLAEREEDLRATMLGLYSEGKIGAIDAFSQWLTTQASGRLSAEAERLGDAFEAELVDARNLRWMAGLVPALEEGGAFVAVGGLHLPGEVGVVALLRERGFTVTPVGE